LGPFSFVCRVVIPIISYNGDKSCHHSRRILSRTARLLELMITLQTRSRFTVQEMADEFAVSRRTMLRDLHALSEMGVPLAATPGPHGGYALITRQRLLPLSLVVDEAIAVLLSYESFVQYAQSPFAAQDLSAMLKLRAVLPPDVVREMDHIQRHIAVAQPTRSYEAPLLADLLQAAIAGVHLYVDYESRTRVSRRLLYPLGLLAEHGFWYCPCYDGERHMVLSLRADRIRAIERIEGLPTPDAPALREWVATRYTGTAGLLTLRARVTRSGAKSFEVTSLFGEVPVKRDGYGVIEAQIPEAEIDWYASQLLSVGTDLVVEEPAGLIDAMRRQAEGITALYAYSR
jgi:predicted DNA-binding transcriptional regulator YafY